MTVTECLAINKLVRYLLNNSVGDAGGIPLVDCDEAKAATMYLVERVNKSLMAGIRPVQVEAAWDKRRGVFAPALAIMRKRISVLIENLERRRGKNANYYATIEALVEIEIDVDSLFQRLGVKAVRSKSGRTTAIDGAIKVKFVAGVPK